MLGKRKGLIVRNRFKNATYWLMWGGELRGKESQYHPSQKEKNQQEKNG